MKDSPPKGLSYLAGTRRSMERIREEGEKHRKKLAADLEAKSKHLYELTKTEDFYVDDVTCQSYMTHVRPVSEIVIGGRSPSYKSGFTSRLTLRVTPSDTKIPVKLLYFDGFSVVKKGERIAAIMAVYKTEELDQFMGQRPVEYYLPRDFNEEEQAIEIMTLNGSIVTRRDRSVDYNRFQKG